MAREEGWLIERRQFGRPEWLRIVVQGNGPRINADLVYTSDANDALRFARREDAEAFMALHQSECVLALATDHAWVDMPRPPFCDDHSCILRNDRPHGHAQGDADTTSERSETPTT